MNTTTDANRWNPTLSHIYTETPRAAIKTGSWAEGTTCNAVTQTTKDCGRKATHIAANHSLCATHAASKYTVDIR